jgi:hypothetical protein
MPATAVLGAQIYQEGWHAFGIYRSLGPGTTCTADKAGVCLQKDWPGMIIDHGEKEKGVYYYIVDAMKPGSGGAVQVTLQAYQNRGPELCANNIDDDGDGLIDCIDTDCIGVLSCPGPVCMPDYKTGPLVPGGNGVTFSFNTNNHNNNQTASCALGGGKDAVVEIDLPQATALKVNCNQTGDHVLGLFTQGEPRDPCDKTKLSCADPQTGPIGCSFYWANMQPGKYYLVVEAFKPGSEGDFSLTLQATTDFLQEICNNGIDDDKDGKTDCQDFNCASKPICKNKTCAPDKQQGLLPTAGTLVNLALTTLGAGDDHATSCAQGGGEDYVVGFSLNNDTSTVKLSFAQFGNHVFSLYSDKGVGYSCDETELSCQSSNNQPTGNILFKNLKAGQYFLIVESAAAGSEGSVVMQLSAQK